MPLIGAVDYRSAHLDSKVRIAPLLRSYTTTWDTKAGPQFPRKR